MAAPKNTQTSLLRAGDAAAVSDAARALTPAGAIPPELEGEVVPVGSISSVMAEVLMESDKDDFEGYAETEEPIIYAAIRQKDLKNEEGQLIRGAGGFRFGATKAPTEPDVKDLIGILVGLGEIRTRFESPDDMQPKCGSRDLKMAEDWGYKATTGGTGRRLCEACPFNRQSTAFDGNTATSCRANLQFFLYELNRKEPVCLQVTPGGRKPWRDFSTQMKREMRAAHRKLATVNDPVPDEVPWIAFILKIRPVFVNEKGGYYRPVFEVFGRVPTETLEKIRAVKADLPPIVESVKKRAARGAGMSGEDMLGAKDAEYVEVK